MKADEKADGEHGDEVEENVGNFAGDREEPGGGCAGDWELERVDKKRDAEGGYDSRGRELLFHGFLTLPRAFIFAFMSSDRPVAMPWDVRIAADSLVEKWSTTSDWPRECTM